MADRVREQLGKLWPRLYGCALALAGDRELAEHLLQECAVRALSARGRPTDEQAVRAWLFTIIRNARVDLFRRSRPARSTAGHLDPMLSPWLFDDRMIAAITVRQGLSQLEPIHRDIIALIDCRVQLCRGGGNHRGPDRHRDEPDPAATVWTTSR